MYVPEQKVVVLGGQAGKQRSKSPKNVARKYERRMAELMKALAKVQEQFAKSQEHLGVL